MLKKLLVFLAGIVCFTGLLFGRGAAAFTQEDLADIEKLTRKCEDEDDSDKTGCLNDLVGELADVLPQIQSLEKTLANEVAYFNTQIALTQIRIQNAIAEIEKRTRLIRELVSDIDDLKVRIESLSESIDYQRNILEKRMRARYKSSTVSPIVVLFGENTVSDVVNKAYYLKAAQIQDQKLLDEMEKTKNAYTQQKNLFETKKEQTEELKASVEAEKANLEIYKQNLSQQRVAKQTLLIKTQNDEAKFQKMLEDAKRELAQIINAAGVLQGTDPKDVDEGEFIGIQGNTGYSFGDHLHFGVYRYGSIDDIVGWDWYHSNTVNPGKKLESKKVYWDTGCESPSSKSLGKGDWEWPIDDPVISQGYGHTCYSDTYYGGKDHPAYDMYGSSFAPVRAVADGKAYFCRNCLGDGANGVFIFHDDDYMTVYWHLQ